MTINETYLVTLRATVTSTYIPLMTLGLYDTFPGPCETFPGHIRWFPEQFDRNIDILRQINSEFIHFLGLWSPSVYLVICFLDSQTGIPGPPGTPDTFPGHIGPFP